MTGRFFVDKGRLLFGQKHDPKTLSQESTRESRREDDITTPQNAQWVGIGETGDRDVEMQRL